MTVATRPTALQAMVLNLRASLRSEVPSRLHTGHVPKLTDDDGTTDRANADEGGVGLPFTAQMHRYIGHWSHWGASRLGTSSVHHVADWCKRLHVTHESEGYGQALCSQMLWEVGRLGQEPQDLAWRHGLPLEQVERMLKNALREADQWRAGREHHVGRTPEGTVRANLEDSLPYERIVRSALPRIAEQG